MNKNTNNICNNCGKHGHLFHQCKLPITSYGVIAFRIAADSKLEYLMIRRKDSFGYIDFIRGKYSPHNIGQIQTIINEMSVFEKEQILTNSFEQLWRTMWGDSLGIQYRSEESAAAKKFELIKSGINSNINSSINNGISDTTKITLQDMVNNSTTSWQETEWEFPKGRRNYQEKDLDCALREFQEETGYPSSKLDIIENVLPYEEIFIGSNHKSYKHKYYLAYMSESPMNDMPLYQPGEVSKMEWKSLDNCLNSIRPYNIDKIKLIKHVEYILNEYKMFYC